MDPRVLTVTSSRSLEHAQGATGALGGPGAREEDGTELEGEGENDEDVESGIVGGDERHEDVPTVSEPCEGSLDVEEGERVRRFADWKESVAALKHSPYLDDREGDGEDDSGPSESLNCNNKSINNYNDSSGDGSHASNNFIFQRMVMKSDVQKRNDTNVAVATNSRNTNSSSTSTSTPPAPPGTTTSSIRMSMSVASHRTQSAGRVTAREAYTLSRGRGRNDVQDEVEPFQREESPRKGRRRAPPPPVEASVPMHSDPTQVCVLLVAFFSASFRCGVGLPLLVYWLLVWSYTIISKSDLSSIRMPVGGLLHTILVTRYLFIQFVYL